MSSDSGNLENIHHLKSLTVKSIHKIPMDNHSKDSNMGKRQTNNTNTVNRRTTLTAVQIKN